MADKSTSTGKGPGQRFRVAASSLDEPGWDYVDAPSVARGMVAILLAAKRPEQPVYHLALGRCVFHRELLEVAAGAAGCSNAVAHAELVPAEGIMAAVQGSVDVSTLANPHWLREEPMRYLPETVNSKRILVKSGDGYLVDNSQLRHEGEGVHYRLNKGDMTKDPDKSMFVAWQSTVYGTMKDGWLEVKADRKAGLDVEPMRQEFGWQATPFSEAIQEYVAWLQSTP